MATQPNEGQINPKEAKAGMKVKLAKGGPEMTLIQPGSDGNWLAEWHHEGTRNTSGFKLGDLVKAE